MLISMPVKPKSFYSISIFVNFSDLEAKATIIHCDPNSF